MPSKNRIKVYVDNGYYHVYNRGVAKQDIFHDAEDKRVFLSHFKRHLSRQPQFNDRGYPYKHLARDVQLLAFCLMSNHFHLLVKQASTSGMTDFLRCTMTSYSMYFNRKYSRVGGLFQDRYKAILIGNDNYLRYVLAYIHLNPMTGGVEEFSSHRYYLGISSAEWLDTASLLEIFGGRDSYRAFMSDQDEHRKANEMVENVLT